MAPLQIGKLGFVNAPALSGRRTSNFASPELVKHRPKSPHNHRQCLRPRMSVLSDAGLQTALSTWGVKVDPHNKFEKGMTVINANPPMLRVENFLTAEECKALIELQSNATNESDLYLNYRVNKEVHQSAASTEAETLISEFSSSRDALHASMKSGFRAQVPCDAVELKPVLERVRDLMGFGDKQFVFAEGMWRRPNRRTVVVRDQTTVFYKVGEGVAPHVDGKDATVLICLQAPEEGGRTVFPEDGVAVKPVAGSALVYESKKGLLHFAEAVGKGEKWVLQLLIDFRVREDELDVDFRSGYVYN